MFAIKCELKTRPYRVIALTTLILCSVSAFYLKLTEQSFKSESKKLNFEFDYFINPMWLNAVTMTTVGYGDMYAQTHMGRSISVINCIIGMILVSLAVITLESAIEFNKEEEKTFSMIKRM